MSVRARTLRASAVLRRLRELGDPRRAAGSERYFRTGPGEYGEGDRFLGLTAPQIRALAAEVRDLPLPEIEALLDSPWHEARLVAVIVLSNAYRRSDASLSSPPSTSFAWASSRTRCVSLRCC